MPLCSKCRTRPRRATHGWCPECKSKYDKARRRVDPSVRERERACELLRKYNLTVEQHQQLLTQQFGKCAICGQDSPQHTDHNHKTGLVRGILCDQCNQGLGKFRDKPELLIAAAFYLRGQALDRKIEQYQGGE